LTKIVFHIYVENYLWREEGWERDNIKCCFYYGGSGVDGQSLVRGPLILVRLAGAKTTKMRMESP